MAKKKNPQQGLIDALVKMINENKNKDAMSVDKLIMRYLLEQKKENPELTDEFYNNILTEGFYDENTHYFFEKDAEKKIWHVVATDIRKSKQSQEIKSFKDGKEDVIYQEINLPKTGFENQKFGYLASNSESLVKIYKAGVEVASFIEDNGKTILQIKEDFAKNFDKIKLPEVKDGIVSIEVDSLVVNKNLDIEIKAFGQEYSSLWSAFGVYLKDKYNNSQKLSNNDKKPFDIAISDKFLEKALKTDNTKYTLAGDELGTKSTLSKSNALQACAIMAIKQMEKESEKQTPPKTIAKTFGNYTFKIIPSTYNGNPCNIPVVYETTKRGETKAYIYAGITSKKNNKIKRTPAFYQIDNAQLQKDNEGINLYFGLADGYNIAGIYLPLEDNKSVKSFASEDGFKTLFDRGTEVAKQNKISPVTDKKNKPIQQNDVSVFQKSSEKHAIIYSLTDVATFKKTQTDIELKPEQPLIQQPEQETEPEPQPESEPPVNPEPQPAPNPENPSGEDGDAIVVPPVQPSAETPEEEGSQPEAHALAAEEPHPEEPAVDESPREQEGHEEGQHDETGRRKTAEERGKVQKGKPFGGKAPKDDSKNPFKKWQNYLGISFLLCLMSIFIPGLPLLLSFGFAIASIVVYNKPWEWGKKLKAEQIEKARQRLEKTIEKENTKVKQAIKETQLKLKNLKEVELPNYKQELQKIEEALKQCSPSTDQDLTYYDILLEQKLSLYEEQDRLKTEHADVLAKLRGEEFKFQEEVTTATVGLEKAKIELDEANKKVDKLNEDAEKLREKINPTNEELFKLQEGSFDINSLPADKQEDAKEYMQTWKNLENAMQTAKEKTDSCDEAENKLMLAQDSLREKQEKISDTLDNTDYKIKVTEEQIALMDKQRPIFEQRKEDLEKLIEKSEKLVPAYEAYLGTQEKIKECNDHLVDATLFDDPKQRKIERENIKEYQKDLEDFQLSDVQSAEKAKNDTIAKTQDFNEIQVALNDLADKIDSATSEEELEKIEKSVEKLENKAQKSTNIEQNQQSLLQGLIGKIKGLAGAKKESIVKTNSRDGRNK